MLLKRFQSWLCISLLIALLGCDGKPAATEVILQTDLGDITLEVYLDKAPNSAGDFLRYIEDGHFSDAGFYRVVRPDNDNGDPIISVIQGGRLDESQALAPVPHEPTSQTGLRHIDGAVSLARDDVGTGSAAAFFICIGDQPSLDEGGMRNKDGAGFAVFGQVIGGMDVVRAILAKRGDAPSDDPYVQGQILSQPVRFQAITR